MSLIDFCSCTNGVEDVAHHFRFVQEHAVAGEFSPSRFLTAAKPWGAAPKGLDLTVARTMDLAAARPFHDLCALVLGDHSLDLHEELVLGGLARRAFEEDRRDPLLAQLVQQQHLVGVLAGEPIGAVNVQHVDPSLRDSIAQPLERGPHQHVEPLEAVVEVNVLGQQHVAVGRHALLERRDLTVDPGWPPAPAAPDPKRARKSRSTSPLASLPSSHREAVALCPTHRPLRAGRDRCVRPRGSPPGTPRADASPTCASERMPCESRSPAASLCRHPAPIDARVQKTANPGLAPPR